MDNASTITDMAKVWITSLLCINHFLYLKIYPLLFLRLFQTQNMVYEIVSDMNSRQETVDDRITTIEERLVALQEQIDNLPELISRSLQQMQRAFQQQNSLENASLQQQQPRHQNFLHPDDASRNIHQWAASNNPSTPNNNNHVLTNIPASSSISTNSNAVTSTSSTPSLMSCAPIPLSTGAQTVSTHASPGSQKSLTGGSLT